MALRSLLLALVASVALTPGASAATLGVEGGVLRLAAAGDRLNATIDFVPGLCSYATKNEDTGVRGTRLDDPAGCFLVDQYSSDPLADRLGPGCTWVDPLAATGKVALFVCGASGVAALDVAGGDRGDAVTFDPGFASPVPVTVSVGAGDRVEARDRSAQTITCAKGGEVHRDARDRSTGCEGDGVKAAGGSVGRDGDALRLSVGTVGDFDRASVDVAFAGPQRSREGLLPANIVVSPAPQVGDGCAQVGERATCGLEGLARFDIAGPPRQPWQLHLDLEGAPALATTVRAGAGGDVLRIRDGVAETVATCGQGTDVVDADPIDRVAGDCEAVDGTERVGRARFGTIVRGQPVAGEVVADGSGTGQAARLWIRCPRSARTGCGGIVQVDWAGARPWKLGERSYSVAPGRLAKIDVAVGHGISRAYYHDRDGDIVGRFQRERRGAIAVTVRRIVGPHRVAQRVTLRGFQRVR
jgi:hypothetical protein